MATPTPPAASPIPIAAPPLPFGSGDTSRIDAANRLLSEFRYGSADHERGLDMLREVAREDGPHAARAHWLLGAYFVQVSARPEAAAEAATWLQRAADAGIAPAIDRLADLCLRGWGVARSPERALTLQQRLAARGFQRAAWEVGYLASQAEAGAEPGVAASAFARACALGYPPAYYSLGLRFATGAGVARDAAFARALLLRAADARFPDARAAADELAPEADAGAAAADWHARLKANLDAAEGLLAALVPGIASADGSLDPQVARLEAHFASVGHPALRIEDGRLRIAPDGGASMPAIARGWNWLAQRPRVAVCADFATREECAHLMHKVADSLTRARDFVRGGDNDDSEITNFNGSGRPLGPMHSDAVVRSLEARIAGMTDWRRDALEPCSIIRYEAGEEYRPHVDFFSDEQIARNLATRNDPGGQRIATFLLYLRAPDLGGETVYEHAGVTVRGEPGLGALHYNVTPDGRQDTQSLHTGRPIVGGEKWLWRSTLREHSLYDAPDTAVPGTPA